MIFKKEIRYCPICEEEHELLLEKMKRTFKMRELEVQSDFIVYACERSNKEFVTGELLSENLMAIKDAYAREIKLLNKE